MIFVALCVIAALACYGMGFIVGKKYAEQKIYEQRKEMQIDEFKEVDPLDELFK